MAWTDPRTWSAGENLLASQLNTYLRDNPLFVYRALASANDFRLTLASGFAVPSLDIVGATTLYCTPSGQGKLMALFDASEVPTLFTSNEFSIPIPATANTNYDVFAYNNAGVPALELSAFRNSGQAITGATNATPVVITANSHGLSNGDEVYISGVQGNTVVNDSPSWAVANVTTNTFELVSSVGNGAYVSNTGFFNARTSTGKLALPSIGVYCKTGDATRRFLATFRTSSVSGQSEDSRVKRLLWNYYNQVRRPVMKQGSGTYPYTTATWRQAAGNAANQVEVVCGLDGMLLSLRLAAFAANSSGSVLASAQFGLDSTSIPFADQSGGLLHMGAAGVNAESVSVLEFMPAVGYHKYVWLEESAASGTTTWAGAAAIGAGGQATSGIYGSIVG